MVIETGVHPARLKDTVASPGGTTIAGLHELARGGMRAALIATIFNVDLAIHDHYHAYYAM